MAGFVAIAVKPGPQYAGGNAVEVFDSQTTAEKVLRERGFASQGWLENAWISVMVYEKDGEKVFVYLKAVHDRDPRKLYA